MKQTRCRRLLPKPKSHQKGMSSGSLEQWLQRLEALHPSKIELGLERVSRVASSLGLLTPQQPVITVAGTNGKGSTVAVLEAVLTEVGRQVGAYTSPHFLRFNERIRVGGEDVPDADIVAAFERIEGARGGTSLTYFEFATLAALQVFHDRQCDVLVLEVGLGGRLDAVNILGASVAVITSIDLDHQAWLGEDRDQIGLEKAGIARAGHPLVIADPAPPGAMMERLAVIGADPVVQLGRDFVLMDAAGNSWSAELRGIDGNPRSLAMIGRGALLPENIAAALQAALLIGVEFSDGQLSAVLQRLALTGRWQWRNIDGRGYLLDVAHNPASVHKMLEYIGVRDCLGRRNAIFSAMNDKDLDGMLNRAAGHFDAWFLADQPSLPRAAPASRIAELLRREGEAMISVSRNLRQAYRRARSVMNEGDQLVTFGSFHTVAAVLPLLDREARR
ncbi:MAG: bifunctional folylpolyglutamate synthase/dihydrofolate synthase [Gammaproteobacteria bacterium]|nr:MAG: bifunctional folylpolyglutamate synthase/dihydrofolate synthase [Gammaproteobacteria bacterium]